MAKWRPPRQEKKQRKRGNSNCMFCCAFCTNAACVTNICRSLIKILNNHFILLSGCWDVIIKEMGFIVVRESHFLQ